jgi:hypothetical protein
MKICAVEAEFFHARELRDVMMLKIVAFCNFAKQRNNIDITVQEY